jgi:DNA polymerase-3 subunit gamma/tau
MGNLHTAYRPGNFDEVVGNKTTINSLKSIIAREREDIPHAILFSGPSGCGKTTLARIFASELGCPDKINGETNSDFIELDIAHLTGVDTAREIRQTMHYYPSTAKCRVWVLDEFHKSSNSFQNAMLKALEDAPKYAYFILCTTEPDKLLKTIRNRCSAFTVESLQENEIKQLLDWVLNEEEFDIPDDVKEEIAEVSEGCPRQALVMLDQIIDLQEDQMLESVKSANVDEKEIRELCQAMLKESSWKKMSGILKGLKKEDPEKIRRSVLGYMATTLLNGEPRAALIIDCFREPVFYTGFPGIVLNAFNALE